MCGKSRVKEWCKKRLKMAGQYAVETAVEDGYGWPMQLVMASKCGRSVRSNLEDDEPSCGFCGDLY
jgi:hypothetical protein